ncbi:hypothetical protein EI555_003834 [Monodon monoceros]|uniref:Uncharacterized protein n=1 Tax=Monodon monoceros TaxID=40151 RepID=A0A4U1FK27_MONMO|nr:hypothetical protein EI555_003834 [Monodon monoceros]
MDVHLDNPGGQESTSNSGKESSSTGNQQDVAMRTDSSEMTDVEPMVNNFASSARAGRRNALPDIQGSAATSGTSELPLKPEVLSVKEVFWLRRDRLAVVCAVFTTAYATND